MLLACITAAPGQSPDPLGKQAGTVQPISKETKKEFRVSKVGKAGATETREKLLELWEVFQREHARRPDEKELTIVHAVRKENDLFLYLATLNGVDVAVRLKNAELLEGETASALLQRDGVLDQPTVLGVPKRYPVYKEIAADDASPEMTKENFISNPKAGMAYEVTLTAKGACTNCFGDGKLSALQNNAECSVCHGTGEAAVRWVVKW